MDKTHRRHRRSLARMAIPRGLWVLLSVLVAVVITVALLYVLRWRGPGCAGGFVHGSVAADSATCSSIGRDILKQGGSPVDGAIAALLCTSVINPQSMGLGGGVIFTIYNASTGQVEVINARERVPSKLSPGFMQQCKDGKTLKTGVKWIGVPGELRGYEAAHRAYGRLPWKTLFEPTIKLITEGVKVTLVLNAYLNHSSVKMEILNSSVCELFCKDKAVLQNGDGVNFTQLAHTLRTVANEGADSFYQGSLAQQMIDDLQNQGSDLTIEDFQNYKINRTQALHVPLGGSYTLYSAPLPAGGALLGFILHVLQGYNFSAESMNNENSKTETYHKIAEVFKFANGQKARLAQPQRYRDTEMFINSLLSQNFSRSIRQRIDSSGNHSLSYYDVSVSQSETYGTSHVSVISQDGSSVSVTSSINQIFGSMVYSPKTGVIFNNQLADFCNAYPKDQLPVKGEQPPSSMSPSIILSHDKKFQLVIGGSGGSFIIPATTQAIMNRLWFGANLTEAIAAPILYVTGNNQLAFERCFDANVTGRLIDKGHQTSKSPFYNVVQAVSQEGVCLFAHSDVRKMGTAVGY